VEDNNERTDDEEVYINLRDGFDEHMSVSLGDALRMHQSDNRTEWFMRSKVFPLRFSCGGAELTCGRPNELKQRAISTEQ